MCVARSRRVKISETALRLATELMATMSVGSCLRRLSLVSSSLLTRYTAGRLPPCSSCSLARLHLSAVTTHVLQHTRCVHTSASFHGLEEFFPSGDNLVEDAEKTGKRV